MLHIYHSYIYYQVFSLCSVYIFFNYTAEKILFFWRNIRNSCVSNFLNFSLTLNRYNLQDFQQVSVFLFFFQIKNLQFQNSFLHFCNFFCSHYYHLRHNPDKIRAKNLSTFVCGAVLLLP